MHDEMILQQQRGGLALLLPPDAFVPMPQAHTHTHTKDIYILDLYSTSGDAHSPPTEPQQDGLDADDGCWLRVVLHVKVRFE